VFSNPFFRGRRLSCGIVILAPTRELLLCHVTGQRHWDLPKGGIHDGETPAEAAVRETMEETGLIFAKSQWPTVAKGSIKLPSTTGELPITVKDIWYNNIPVDASETDRSTALTDLFDNRCNASATPQSAPKAFAAPTVKVSSDANAPTNETGDEPIDDTGADGSDNGAALANTGAGQLIALGLLALAALQVGAIVTVRAQRSSPRPAAHRAKH